MEIDLSAIWKWKLRSGKRIFQSISRMHKYGNWIFCNLEMKVAIWTKGLPENFQNLKVWKLNFLQSGNESCDLEKESSREFPEFKSVEIEHSAIRNWKLRSGKRIFQRISRIQKYGNWIFCNLELKVTIWKKSLPEYFQNLKVWKLTFLQSGNESYDLEKESSRLFPEFKSMEIEFSAIWKWK